MKLVRFYSVKVLRLANVVILHNFRCPTIICNEAGAEHELSEDMIRRLMPVVWDDVKSWQAQLLPGDQDNQAAVFFFFVSCRSSFR